MPKYDQACKSCDWLAEIIARPHEHPPCPKCGGDTERRWEGKASSVHGDDIPGGMLVENGFSEPIRVYSHSEHRRRLAAEGCEIRAKWAGPNDKYLTRWDSVDLEGAAQLVQRGVEARIAKRKTHFPKATESITVTIGETFRA